MKEIVSVIAAAALTGCGIDTTTATSRTLDDAGTSAAGSSGAGGSGASEGGTRDAGGGTRDAGAPDGAPADAGRCEGGPVTHVVASRAPESPADGGEAAGLRRVDGGFVFITPTDPCTTYPRPRCPGAPRWIFGCPSVTGPNGSTVVHPGDQVTVKVPITDEGLGAYSCNGIDTDQPLLGSSALSYAVKPGYVEETGQIPPSTRPGTVYHFTAAASGSRYTPGTACEDDLTQLDFDMTVD